MLALIKAALFPNVLAYNKTEAFKPDHVSNLNHHEEVKCFENNTASTVPLPTLCYCMLRMNIYVLQPHDTMHYKQLRV